MADLNKVANAVQTITGVATSFISLMTVGKELYQMTVAAMDLVENFNNGLTGAQKKAEVLAFVSGQAGNIGIDFSKYASTISAFIDSIKNLYNSTTNFVTAAQTALHK